MSEEMSESTVELAELVMSNGLVGTLEERVPKTVELLEWEKIGRA